MTDREYVNFLSKCANIPYTDYSWLKDHCYKTLERPCSPNTRNEHLAILDLIKEHEERERQWIPCSERLPEETVSVLVYAERNAYNDKGKFRKKVIDIGWQVDGIWHIDRCSGVVGIAWMPLPTPPNKSEIPTGAESEVRNDSNNDCIG